jgi:UDP-N-acetylmuramate dehydrogenase
VNPRDVFGDDARIVYDAELDSLSTYGVRARAGALLTLSEVDDLEELTPGLLALEPTWRILGAGSNVLLGEGARDLLLVRLRGAWSTLDVDESGTARLGAGLALPVAARRLAGAGWTGCEWAVGIPGSAGGAVVMNAGGHGADLASVLRSVTLWRAGEIVTVPAADLGLSYRHSLLGERDLVVGLEITLEPGEKEQSEERLREIVRWRREHQPGGRNAGSVFTNPPGDHAARLLEAAGLKGRRVGGAEVSEKHANFILCAPGTRAEEVAALMVLMRTGVHEAFGVWLETEHRFIGLAEPW